MAGGEGASGGPAEYLEFDIWCGWRARHDAHSNLAKYGGATMYALFLGADEEGEGTSESAVAIDAWLMVGV
jgi:hypothetical protein